VYKDKYCPLHWASFKSEPLLQVKDGCDVTAINYLVYFGVG